MFVRITLWALDVLLLAMEDAIINEIANKCEVDTCEISDQVTDSKETEGRGVRGCKGEGDTWHGCKD